MGSLLVGEPDMYSNGATELARSITYQLYWDSYAFNTQVLQNRTETVEEAGGVQVERGIRCRLSLSSCADPPRGFKRSGVVPPSAGGCMRTSYAARSPSVSSAAAGMLHAPPALIQPS
jgi:hypothetical protein